MRRASSKFLSFRLQKVHPKSSFRDFAAQFSSIFTINEQNNHPPLSPRLKSYPQAQTPRQILSDPSCNLSTLAAQQNPSSQLHSRQRKIEEKSRPELDLESAKTADEMVKAFEEMEASFDGNELGLACLRIGLKLDLQNEDPEKVLYYGNRALKVLDKDDDNMSLHLAMNLQLLGSACYSLNRYDDSLKYLNRADCILGKLDEQNMVDVIDIKEILHAVHFDLANTKNALGKREDALGNLKRCLEIKEETLEKDNKELGDSYREMAEAYVSLLYFKEALPYCMKAMEIHKVQLGSNSVEVANDRRLLGVIYTGLEEHGKALEQNQLSQRVLKNWGLHSDLIRAHIDAANMQIALGKIDEAINTLKGIFSQTDKESQDRAMVFISMSKALYNQEKFPDSKRCLEIACGILDKNERTSPLQVSEAYIEISMQYETMNEFETAVSLLKMAQAILEKIPQEQHSVGSVSARIGWLLLLTGKVQQAVPYLEDAIKRLKESFGAKHYGIGFVYNNLGAAYLELDRPESAAEVFAKAKDIMDISLGPHHVDSIEACQNLSKAYNVMGNLTLAIKFQEKAVEAWKYHGLNANDELKEAKRVLEQLNTKACGYPPDIAAMQAHGRRNRSSQPCMSVNVKLSKAY